MKRKCLSLVCAAALTAGLLTTPVGASGAAPLADQNGVAIAGQGWFETICAELTGVKDADVTAVAYTGADGVEHALAGDDFAYLVRDMDGGVRIDIPGVAAGTYSLSVTAGEETYTAENIQVKAYDRSGFAHQTVDENSACTPYTEGVGAYNDDGTLKDNAQVIYVTDETKDTVTATFSRYGDQKIITGIGNILNSNNSKVNLGLLEFSSRDGIPLVVRFLGTVNQPQGVSAFKLGSSNGGMVQMLSGANITLEGIGPDATIQGWGFSFGADKDDTQYNKKARNFEVRNLSFKNVPEDCIEITGHSGGIETVEHAWVHHCAFYVPDYIENAAESDKHYGDGALDFKFGSYMTSSYNYFEGCKKTSLIGGADGNQQYHVTWHHNWWKGCNSRAPLARQADIHIYNCLLEGQTSYCMSLRANCYIFSENNTFLDCKNPVEDYGSGGVCKSVGDVFTNCTGTNAAQQVAKDAQVTSASKFANFDTAAGSYIVAGNYRLDTAANAVKKVQAYAGPMKDLVAQGELGQGDDALLWSYAKDGTLELLGTLPETDQVLAACWDDQGCFAGVKVLDAASMRAELGTGWSQVKLFWLNDGCVPQCAAESWEKE